MLTEWSVRDEVFAIAHRWPLPVLAFLIGSLLSWGITFILPSPYQAEENLFVAYNADSVYRNPDDYKNWQMRQLNDFATADIVLNETLDRLRSADPYWQTVDLPQFRSMLEVLWRNAGKWRLVVNNQNPMHSIDAVQVWTQVLLEQYDQSIGHAVQMIAVDKQLQANANSLDEMNQRLTEATSLQQNLQAWQAQLQQQAPNQSVSAKARSDLWSLATSTATLSPGWQAVIQALPDAAASEADYQAWLGQALTFLDAEIKLTQTQAAQLEGQKTELTAQMDAETQASRGLSAHLEIGLQYVAPIEAKVVRPTGIATLAGGLIGILIWSLIWLAYPLWQTRK